MQIHKLDRAKDETKLLVGAGQQRYPPKTAASLLLCYRCGAARRGEETVREIEIPPYVETDAPLISAVPKPALFEDGVPDGSAGLRCAGGVAGRYPPGDR